MKFNNRYILLGLILVIAAACMYGAYGFVRNHQGGKGPSLGVVQIEDVLEFNPSYEDYKLAKAELEQMQRQYEIEQAALNDKAQLQDEQLKTLALNDTLTDALNVELQTRISTKENELNRKLDKKRAELSQKYLAELKVANNAYDLEIVNLQLDLYAYESRIYYDDAQKAAAESEKQEKEARLKELLEQRKPSNIDVETIRNRIDKELEPMIASGQKELTQYAESVQADLAKKREEMMQNQVQAIIKTNNLPIAQEWNETWSKKLSDKEAEVNALHEAILEDVRMRAAIIANEQHLDLIIIDNGGNIKGLDITDAIKASYRVQ